MANATVYIYNSARFNNYHSGGGLVVVANTQEEHDKLLAEAKVSGGKWTEGELESEGELTASYKIVRGKVPAAIWLYPDAGCC